MISGFDGGKFDYAIVYTDVGIVLQCFFTKYLDNGDFEEGKNCIQL